MIPPTGMKELSVTTSNGERVLKAGRDGLFEIKDPKLAKKLKQEGLGVASLGGIPRAEGYTCAECGFNSWFRKCSRCGNQNGTPERDGE